MSQPIPELSIAVGLSDKKKSPKLHFKALGILKVFKVCLFVE